MQSNKKGNYSDRWARKFGWWAEKTGWGCPRKSSQSGTVWISGYWKTRNPIQPRLCIS